MSAGLFNRNINIIFEGKLQSIKMFKICTQDFSVLHNN